MDAQTRHALKTNDFGEMLASLRDSVGTPGFRKWLLVLGLLVVAIIAWQFWRASARRSTQSAWTELTNTMYTADRNEAISSLRNQLQQHPTGSISAAARLMLAHLLMEEGLTDPAKAQTNTSEAADHLRRIVESADLSEAYKGAARFKLATALETLGQFDEARTHYQALTQQERFAGSPYRKPAEERLKDLEQIAKIPPFAPGNAPVASQPAAMPPVDTTIQMPLDVTPPAEPATSPAAPDGSAATPAGAAAGDTSDAPAEADAVPATQPAAP